MIKKVSCGLLVGSVLGAFGVVHDGGFGMHLTIIDEDGFSVGYSISSEKCGQFFSDMGVVWHEELIKKNVIMLNNNGAINSVEKIIPHYNIIIGLEK